MSAQSPTIEISGPEVLARQPLVSVYMAAYRHEDFIASAIEGVIAQDCDFPIELIIGEDQSPDGTRQIVLDYQRRFPNLIRVVTSECNVGARANAARSHALARGEYIAICEGDDYWMDPSKLRRQVEVFRNNPGCSLVFHGANIIDASSGQRVGRSRWSLRDRRFTLEELIAGDGGMVPTASILIRRSVLVSRPDWAMDAPVGDYPLVLHAGVCGDVVYLDRTMSVYRCNVPHSWTQRHAPTLAHRLRYAQQIDAMLASVRATDRATSPSVDKAIQYTVSKYYSDVLVQIDGPRSERKNIYALVRGKLSGSDRMFAWLAGNLGVRLKRSKNTLRMMRTLSRLLRMELRRDLSIRNAG